MLFQEMIGMSGMRLKGLVAAFVTGSLIASSTSAIAAGTPGPAGSQQISPWAALTALSAGAPAATLCGAAAAAAASGQAPATGCVLPVMDAPPPVAQGAPPAAVGPAVAPAGYALSPLFLALGALAAGALGFFLVRNNHHHPISPA